jgi:hypothetical protein
VFSEHIADEDDYIAGLRFSVRDIGAIKIIVATADNKHLPAVYVTLNF